MAKLVTSAVHNVGLYRTQPPPCWDVLLLHPMSRPIYTVSFFIIAISAIGALAAPRDAAAIARDQQWAQEERDTATRIRDYDAGLAQDVFRYGAFMKADLRQSKEAAEAEAKVHENIAAAHERGDEAEVERLKKEADRASRINLMWRDRIGEWRKRQADAAPDEQWFQEQSRWYRGSMDELLAWAEARQAASEAWGRVAEAIVPGADAKHLADLKEQAFALDAQREIAELRFTWANELHRTLGEKPLSSPEIRASLEKLKKAQDERIAFRLAEIEHSRRGREIERRLREADQEFRDAYDAAQRERQRRSRR